MSASCLAYSPSPPKDVAYNNTHVLDRLVTRHLVACNLTGKNLVVDSLVVNNDVVLPTPTVLPGTTYGTYNPVVLISTNIIVTSGPTATFYQNGKVVNVTGSMGVNIGAAPLTCTISLPVVADAGSFGLPEGLCNYLQDPLPFNSGAGIVFPFSSTPQVAEIHFTGPGGIPGRLAFTFSYVAA